ncbi:hypothetical protein OUZ56_017415 [Daphnia magna]|uniref:CxC3 like cysteine cluster domain-containing protein n=1 Tax=Daphnia magna TaxID=35525 RepID=A0ABR0ASR4_9CRUS|nr:hypothetical protein OUZ56_017415 [Daphnia magna]
MYARTLEDVSKEYGRNGPINVPLFTTAEREWETCRHYIDQEVLKRDKTHCPSCGKEPLVRSSDAIVKLRRLSSAGKVHNPENERTMEQPQARFGNLVIKSDTEVENFRQRIYNKTKKKQMCGGSAFKAAREDSNEQKKYDETGLVVSSCKHCVVPYAINMFKGESWTHTAFMHNEAMKSNAKFFCYDVVCQYWKWMKTKVARHFPEYRNLTSEMTGILPIMHKNAHQLPCKILWNPRWTTGMGLTGGEEHEQVFSKLYLYAYVLKHMTKHNRNDFLTLAILYWNWGKIENMHFLLRKKLEKARKEIKQGTPKLEKLLETHNLVYNDLPLIHKELETKAKAILDQRKTKKTTSRTKLRRVLTETKRKALETIELINSKDTTLPISYEDFNEGVFPWETVLDRVDTHFPTLSLADKYNIVDCWMLLKRAREEITLSKNEMINYMRFLIDKRSSLQQPSQKHTGEDEKFAKGKSVMKVSEVHHLNLKIQMALTTFNLKCNQDFSDFVCETQTNHSEPEFEFDTSDEDNYDSLSESEYSDEETESSSSYSEDDESAI